MLKIVTKVTYGALTFAIIYLRKMYKIKTCVIILAVVHWNIIIFFTVSKKNFKYFSFVLLVKFFL